ncbi:MAG: FtsW/RodA/SpoVE family cell cycle protein [Planctomycetota bacterium]
MIPRVFTSGGSDRSAATGLSPSVCGKAAAVIAFVLTAVGVVTIYSSGTFWAAQRYDDPDYFIKRQILGVAIGAAAFLACAFIPYRMWGKRSREVFLFTALLLVLVLVVGSRFNGSRRWLRFAGIGLQPSELAKLAVLIHVAAFLAAGRADIRSFKRGFVPALLPVAMLSALVLIEPDFGTSLLVATLGVIVLIVGGLRLTHLLVAMAALLPAVTIVMFTRFGYIRERLGFFLGEKLPHQVEQGLIALGSGGLLGKGMGAGTGKLFYVPEVAGDFIFPAFGEEAGFVGVLFVLVLFAAFAWFGWRVATGVLARDTFAFYLALGISFWIPFQALLNMAVVSNSMPPKGIALPFISFGSSALVMNLAAVGILLNVARSSAARESAS